jgi:catechol 2,3-dioxygenase-like lactoylglutathione lyase family enzyme
MREIILDKNNYKNFKGEGAPEDFHHVAWKTMKYDEMIDFYSRLFHMKPLYSSEDLTFLTFDEEHHRVAIANISAALKENMGALPRFIINSLVKVRNFVNKVTPNLVGLDHVSYKMDSIESWFDFYHKAKENGLEPVWTINHGWISGIYYRDPDGHLVEIFYEHFRSAEEFRSNAIAPDFAEEPIGTNMDIDVLYDMYKNGTPFEELILKGNTVPKGKKPVFGFEAVMNMRKKFK